MLTAAAFLLAYSAGCFLALFRHPIYGFVTYISLIYIHPPTTWWGVLIPSVRWSLLAAGVTVVAVLLHGRGQQRKPIFSYGVMRGLIVFLLWLLMQSLWTINPTEHSELLTLMLKYVVLVWLMVRCLDSVKHIKYFLFAHSAGCFYLGTIVIADYIGGRFEGFTGPGVDEANTAALQIVTGIIVTFVIFLSGKKLEKIAAFGFMPFILNALVATISRSGFLALGVSGVLFNLFVPKKNARLVRLLSVVGLVLFASLTNPIYWERIGTILTAGEEIEGQDTGIGRLVLMKAQFEMFAEYPMGCGHRCTATLSPLYLDDIYLTGYEGNRGRSSHNTFLTLMVEQGIPGMVMYLLYLSWILRMALRLRERMCSSSGILATTYTATVAILGAITVGDLFVDYLKFETRFLFIALFIVIDQMAANEVREATADGKSVRDPQLEKSGNGRHGQGIGSRNV